MNYELRNLTIGYGKLVVCDNIQASLQAGELTCLLGPNGTGKSTLLRTLCAFQPALAGKLLLDGKDIHDLSSQELSRRLGVVLTDRVSIPGLSVRDLIAMGRSPYTNYWGKLTASDEAIIDQSIEECGIQNLVERDSTTLSDGERQKVMIAKALAQQTPIILLDEPTAFLDFPSKVETMLLLSRLAHQGGKSILISTHDLDLALQTSDRLWLMGANGFSPDNQKESSTLVTGTPQELANNGTLERCFSTSHVCFSAAQLRFTITK